MPLGLQSVIFGKTTYWVELKISAVSCTECTQTSKHRDQKSLLGSVQMQTKVREPLQKWQNSTFRCVWCGHSSTGWGGREGLTESCLRQGFSLLCWFSSRIYMMLLPGPVEHFSLSYNRVSTPKTSWRYKRPPRSWWRRWFDAIVEEI